MDAPLKPEANRVKYLWVLGTALAFGTMEVALKIGGGHFSELKLDFLRCFTLEKPFSPLQLTFLRFFIGGLFLLPFALRDLARRKYRLTRGDWAFCALEGICGVVVSMTLFQMSVNASNANLAAVLISMNPMFTMAFAHFVAGERFTLRKGLVLAVCIGGLVLVAAPWKLAAGNTVEGIFLGLGAAIFFGLYTALSKRRVKRIGGMALNSFSFLLGGLVELGILLAKGEPVTAGICAKSLPLLAYVSLVVTGFGYFCFMKAVENAGATTASYAFFIKPIIAAVLAYLVLGNEITWNIALGIAIIVTACVYNARRR